MAASAISPGAVSLLLIPFPPLRRPSALDVHQVDDEDQRRVRLDRWRLALRAVGQVRRDDQLAPPALLHADQALVPSLDHLAGAELEVEGLSAVIGAVELLTGLVVDTDVLDRELVTCLRRRAAPFLQILELELVGRGAVGYLDLGLIARRGRRRGRLLVREGRGVGRRGTLLVVAARGERERGAEHRREDQQL